LLACQCHGGGGHLNAGPALGDVVGAAVHLVDPRPEHAPFPARVEERLGREQVAVVDPAPVPDVGLLAVLHRHERVGLVVVPPDHVVVLVGGLAELEHVPHAGAVRRRVQPFRALLRHGKEVGALPAGDARRGVQRQGVPLPADEVRAPVDYGGADAVDLGGDGEPPQPVAAEPRRGGGRGSCCPSRPPAAG